MSTLPDHGFSSLEPDDGASRTSRKPLPEGMGGKDVGRVRAGWIFSLADHDIVQDRSRFERGKHIMELMGATGSVLYLFSLSSAPEGPRFIARGSLPLDRDRGIPSGLSPRPPQGGAG